MGMKELARDGTRWPSGLRRAQSSRARPSRPNQTVQVAGRAPGLPNRKNREDAEVQRRKEDSDLFRISPRLCVSAVSAIEFRSSLRMGVHS